MTSRHQGIQLGRLHSFSLLLCATVDRDSTERKSSFNSVQDSYLNPKHYHNLLEEDKKMVPMSNRDNRIKALHQRTWKDDGSWKGDLSDETSFRATLGRVCCLLSLTFLKLSQWYPALLKRSVLLVRYNEGLIDYLFKLLTVKLRAWLLQLRKWLSEFVHIDIHN